MSSVVIGIDGGLSGGIAFMCGGGEHPASEQWSANPWCWKRELTKVEADND